MSCWQYLPHIYIGCCQEIVKKHGEHNNYSLESTELRRVPRVEESRNMTSKILINDAYPSETRIALVSDGELIDFDLQSEEHFRTKSNIYKGIVTRVEPSLEAFFVNYGEVRNGFLPAKEVNSDYFPTPYRRNKDMINNIKVGQELIVQVVKEAREDKGAALTTFITMSSRSIVLNRGYSKKINVSRNITGDNRDRIHDIISSVGVPDGFAAIVRTSAANLSVDEIKWDIDYLHRLWEGVQRKSEEVNSPSLILMESDVITRTIRDRLNDEIDEVVTDTEASYERVKNIVSQVSPKMVNKVSLYNSDIPLFYHYGIEKTVQSAFKRIVDLPSGGKLVIDRSEAMFIIDVNSSQSNKGASVEDTALNNNLEALKEIARQMRVRDIGGLVIIDFIDMMRHSNNTRVEQEFMAESKKDKAYVRMSKISMFGMMEVSRQRLRSSLDEFYLEKCPRCNGSGKIFTLSGISNNIFRSISETASNSLTKEISYTVAQDIYDHLNDFYGNELKALRDKYPEKIVLTLNEEMSVSQYSMQYTDVNGVTSETQAHSENSGISSYGSGDAETVNRQPLMDASDVLNQTPPNKSNFISRFFSKLYAIMKKLWRSDKKSDSDRRRHRRGGRPGGRDGGYRGSSRRRHSSSGGRRRPNNRRSSDGRSSDGRSSDRRPSDRRSSDRRSSDRRPPSDRRSSDGGERSSYSSSGGDRDRNGYRGRPSGNSRRRES